MRIKLDEFLININSRLVETPIYSILATKEAAEEYNRINGTSSKLGDTVVSYRKRNFEPIEI